MNAVFFDLDGTLTDSAPGVLACVRYACERLGIDPGDRVRAEHFLGPPLMASFTAQFGLDEERARQAVTWYRERYAVTGLYENRVYDGVVPMLAALRREGVRLGVATGKPEVFTGRVLAHFGLAPYFDVVVTASLADAGDEKPAVLRRGMTLLGLSDADRCVMVGDRASDIRAALACGAVPVGVTYGAGSERELRDAGARLLADSPARLSALLEQITQE